MGRKNILLIEDNIVICNAISELLEFENYNVIVTNNGQEGLHYLKKQETVYPHLILLDLMMPVMDGFHFLKAKQADPSIAIIPVFVMSADGRNFEDIKKLGVAHCFKKPLDIDQLLQAIKQLESAVIQS